MKIDSLFHCASHSSSSLFPFAYGTGPFIVFVYAIEPFLYSTKRCLFVFNEFFIHRFDIRHSQTETHKQNRKKRRRRKQRTEVQSVVTGTGDRNIIIIWDKWQCKIVIQNIEYFMHERTQCWDHSAQYAFQFCFKNERTKKNKTILYVGAFLNFVQHNWTREENYSCNALHTIFRLILIQLCDWKNIFSIPASSIYCLCEGVSKWTPDRYLKSKNNIH